MPAAPGTSGTSATAGTSGEPATPAPALGAAPLPSGINVSTAALVLLSVAALYFGRDIFLPFALAILLSFMLAPPVGWLRRLRIPRVPSVIIVVSSAVLLLGGISVLVGSQVVELGGNLSLYQKTMQEKIRAIRASSPGGGAIDRTTEVIQAIGEELSAAPESAQRNNRANNAKPKKDPIPVQVVPGDNQPFTQIQNIVGPLLNPIGTAGLVIIFIFFVLLEPSDLRDRFIRLAGSDLHRTTEALSEAAQRVSRYLVMQLIINATYGLPLGLGLYLIGVPGAPLWALLATLLRFVPYLGPFIAALFPLTLAFAVDPGWDMFIWTVALVLTLELISNNVIEPWLYGSSTGLTPVAVILAAIFWTLLWGPVGLVLATPLTVCLVVMGRYVPQLAFLDVLLGADPVLQPEERFYQRLLAGNVEEAIEIAETHVVEHSLMSFYDDVAVPSLRLAENALQAGSVPEDRRKVADGVISVVLDLREQAERLAGGHAAPQPVPHAGTPVLCIAGRSELDAAASAMLGHLLESQGIGTRQAPPSAVTLDAINRLDLAGVELVFLTYLGNAPKAYARFVCRRLKHRMPQLKIVLCTWNLAPEVGNADQLVANAGADVTAADMHGALDIAIDLLGQRAAPSMEPPPLPRDEQARLAALQASGILAADKGVQLDRVAHRIADALEMPIALVSLVDDSCQLWKGADGLPEDLNKLRQTPREVSICGHVVAAGMPIVIEDTARDARFADNPMLRERNLRFYAGVPLRTSSGHVIGSLCVLDHKPRTLGSRDIKLLQVVADELMAELELKSETLSPASPAESMYPQDGAAPAT